MNRCTLCTFFLMPGHNYLMPESLVPKSYSLFPYFCSSERSIPTHFLVCTSLTSNSEKLQTYNYSTKCQVNVVWALKSLSKNLNQLGKPS